MRKLCLSLLGWMLVFPNCHALVKSGGFLHVGSLELRYVPSSMQLDGVNDQSDDLLSLQLKDFVTYVGVEKLTFAFDFRSFLNTSDAFLSFSSTAFHNDVYYQLSPNFSFGIGLSHVWIDGISCQVESPLGKGAWLEFVLKWRW